MCTWCVRAGSRALFGAPGGPLPSSGPGRSPPYLPFMYRTAALLALLLAPLPASAWEFFPGPVCRLIHTTPDTGVELTYDPAGPLYTLTVSRPGQPFPTAPIFGMRFDGPRGLTIATDRHENPDGDPTRLRVTDTGFGNVLDGLQFNRTATAVIGGQEIGFGLDGAADPVAAFRACADAVLS